MQRASFIVLVLLAALATLLVAENKEQKVSTIKVVVLKADNGKPVRNASVVLHEVDSRGKQAKGGLELKTDSEGRASLDGIPYGKLRVQVIMRGFQTYGQDHDISQPEQELVIKLKRPQEQYSIYK